MKLFVPRGRLDGYRVRVLSLVAALGVVACNDVGDDTNFGGLGGGSDASADVTLGEGGGESGASGEDAAEDASVDAAEDASPSEGGSSPEDGGGEDAVATDSGGDIGSTETLPDAEPDVRRADGSGTELEAAADTGAPDAAEASAPDGPLDSGMADATLDGGTIDSGLDAEQDAPQEGSSTGPTACTSSPCASSGPNSLQCGGNDSSGADTGVCTPMEAAFMNFDKTGACYACMVGGGCFDAPHQPAVECGDLTASFTNGAGTALTAAQAQQDCMDTLNCIFGSGTATAGGTCASNAAGVSWCYCAEAATTCASAAPSSLTGACTSTELAGFAYNTSSATPVSQQVLDEQTGATSQPSGAATGAFACAILNGCTSCY
jgi:hypothetical protein